MPIRIVTALTILAVLGLAEAADKDKPVPPVNTTGPRPYTILGVQFYDGTWLVEPLKKADAPWRLQQLSMDFRVIEEANKRAREAWNTRYFSKDGWRWVLEKPVRPIYSAYGSYPDEFDAQDKIIELKKIYEQKMSRMIKSKDYGTQAWLISLEENKKIVKLKIPEARDALHTADEAVVTKISIAKKREIWDKVHQAELEAKQYLLRRLEKGEDLDPVDVYTLQQRILLDVYTRYEINEFQWVIIWEEGDKAGWPVPTGTGAAAQEKPPEKKPEVKPMKKNEKPPVKKEEKKPPVKKEEKPPPAPAK
ncbi:MAG: hypothetical protein V1809_00370 [Planctomycetota bacterium]